MAKDIVMLCVSLTDEDAAAFATFLQRAGFTDFRQLSDGPDQTYGMLHAAARLLEALSGVGFGE